MLSFSLQGAVIDDIPQVFEALFECTLHMINKELEPFPEHRINFFKMLQAITTHCFPGEGEGVLVCCNVKSKMLFSVLVSFMLCGE